MKSSAIARTVGRSSAAARNSAIMVAWSRGPSSSCSNRSSLSEMVSTALFSSTAYPIGARSPNPPRTSDAMPASTIGIRVGNVGPCINSQPAVPGWATSGGKMASSRVRNHSAQGRPAGGGASPATTRSTTCRASRSLPPTWWYSTDGATPSRRARSRIDQAIRCDSRVNSWAVSVTSPGVSPTWNGVDIADKLPPPSRFGT